LSLIVQKYGGTSVGTPERIKAVASHIAQTVRSGHKVVVVVSAMGEQTDELIALAHKFSADPPRRELDMLLTTGERITMALVSIALHEIGVSAISLTGSQSGILTDETHGNARIQRILGDRIRESLERSNVTIVAGFQGVSPRTKEITTLGRGGSDLSAIALAAALKAESCELYKDVDAVFSADPRLVPTARPVSEIPWEAMCDLAWAGASVLHSRGAHVALRWEIPVRIRSSFNLSKPGTLVRGHVQQSEESEKSMESLIVHAVAQKKDMSLVRFAAPAGFSKSLLKDTLSDLWTQGETPLVNQLSATGSGRELVQVMSSKQANRLAEQLKVKGVRASVTGGLASITMVGSGFWQNPESVAEIEEIAEDATLIEVRNSSVVICLQENQMQRVANALHERFVIRS
jgi:aspartate kinase